MRIDVRRALHVDPEEVVALLGALDQPIEVAVAQRRIQVEPELRRLDGDLRVEPRGRDLVEHVEVVSGDLLGLLDARDVLAEPRQDRVDALRLAAPSPRAIASSMVSPGMKRRHRSPHEP